MFSVDMLKWFAGIAGVATVIILVIRLVLGGESFWVAPRGPTLSESQYIEMDSAAAPIQDNVWQLGPLWKDRAAFSCHWCDVGIAYISYGVVDSDGGERSCAVYIEWDNGLSTCINRPSVAVSIIE